MKLVENVETHLLTHIFDWQLVKFNKLRPKQKSRVRKKNLIFNSCPKSRADRNMSAHRKMSALLFPLKTTYLTDFVSL